MPPDCPIYIIDDDPDLCRSLILMLAKEQMAATTWLSATGFLHDLDSLPAGIIICEACMAEMEGLALLAAVRAHVRSDPMIVITGQANVPLAVRALKAGVVDFLEIPLDDAALFTALGEARDRLTGGAAALSSERVATLSRREREVFEWLIDGATNKRIAHELGISPRTVEIYRSKLMEKMHASNISRLVRMGLEAGIGRAEIA